MRRWLVPLLVAAALPAPAAAFTNPQIPGLQVALRAHGYDPGPIDGIVGPATQRELLTKRRPTLRPRALARTHLVLSGDTLTALAIRYATTVAALERANRLRPGAFLLIGARLRVPLGARHVPGTDVRGSIDRWAAHYGVDPHLARGLAWMESGFQPKIRSPIGAWGVMPVA